MLAPSHQTIASTSHTKLRCPGNTWRALAQPATASSAAAITLRSAMSGVACQSVAAQAARSKAGVTASGRYRRQARRRCKATASRAAASAQVAATPRLAMSTVARPL
jgi:hypothetical protein